MHFLNTSAYQYIIDDGKLHMHKIPTSKGNYNDGFYVLFKDNITLPRHLSVVLESDNQQMQACNLRMTWLPEWNLTELYEKETTEAP